MAVLCAHSGPPGIPARCVEPPQCPARCGRRSRPATPAETWAVGALVPRGRVSQRGKVSLGGGVDQVTQNRIGAEVLARFAQTARPMLQESALVGPQDPRRRCAGPRRPVRRHRHRGRPAQNALMSSVVSHTSGTGASPIRGWGAGIRSGTRDRRAGQHGLARSERTLGRCCRGRGVGPVGCAAGRDRGDHARGGEQPHLLAQQHQFLGVGERRLCLVWTAHPLRQNRGSALTPSGSVPGCSRTAPAPGARRHDRVPAAPR